MADDTLPLLAEIVHHGTGAWAEGDVPMAVQVDVVLHRLGGDLRDRLQAALVDIDPTLYGDQAGPGDELPELRPVPVWLDQLSTHLESSAESPWGGHDWRLDLGSGDLVSEEFAHEAGSDLPEHWEDDEQWLDVPMLGSRGAWRDMEEFALDLEDGELGERLRDAIQGRGAFRRFQRLPDDELVTHVAWRIHSEQRRLGRARAWLAGHGCRAVPARPPQQSPWRVGWRSHSDRLTPAASAAAR